MGLCLSGVLPDGVLSEWGYAQWGFVHLPLLFFLLVSVHIVYILMVVISQYLSKIMYIYLYIYRVHDMLHFVTSRTII